MLQIRNVYASDYKDDSFCVATTTASPYTPFFNYDQLDYIYDDDARDLLFTMYHKPIRQGNFSSFRLDSFYDYLNRHQAFRHFYLNSDQTVFITVGYGCIYDKEGKLLMMLSVKAGKKINFIDRYYDGLKKENAENLTLFVSTELIINPVYKLFYGKLEKGYIHEAFKIELPVIFTTSDEIERLHYSNDFKVEFNQISDFEHHLQTQVGKFLNCDNSLFNTVNPGLGKQEIVQEVVEPVNIFLAEELRTIMNELNTIPVSYSSLSQYVVGVDTASNNTSSFIRYDVSDVMEIVGDNQWQDLVIERQTLSLLDDTEDLL